MGLKARGVDRHHREGYLFCPGCCPHLPLTAGLQLLLSLTQPALYTTSCPPSLTKLHHRPVHAGCGPSAATTPCPLQEPLIPGGCGSGSLVGRAHPAGTSAPFLLACCCSTQHCLLKFLHACFVHWQIGVGSGSEAHTSGHRVGECCVYLGAQA